MRILESAPRRYDFGVRLLSLGHIERVYGQVAQLARGPNVLDLGCGTGNMTKRLTHLGFCVTGVDASPEMLAVARKKVLDGPSPHWLEAGAVELIDHFPPDSFDSIVSVLLFSELSPAEQQLALRQCHTLLRPGGRLILADEVRPEKWTRRVLHSLLRLPLIAITYALTQTGTTPVRGLKQMLTQAGFHAVTEARNRLGNFAVIAAEKREA